MIACITGITGQDGSYLTELLLQKGYEVHGIVRRSSNTARLRLDHLTSNNDVYNRKLFLHYAELDDSTTLRRILARIRPTELYHLAGQSHVGLSFEVPESTCEFTAMGTLRLLEVLRDLPLPPRLLHASSSEVFGRPDQSPQNEDTPFAPITPYGIAKTFATQMVSLYREAHGFFACNAICFNHESPRRGESFVTRKITRAAARIKLRMETQLCLGNLDTRRDWGYAAEYAEAMWLMLQRDKPRDFVLATGESHSVRDFLRLSFERVSLNWEDYTQTATKHFRPAEVERLVGDASRAKSELSWVARTRLPDLVRIMVDADLDLASRNQ